MRVMCQVCLFSPRCRVIPISYIPPLPSPSRPYSIILSIFSPSLQTRFQISSTIDYQSHPWKLRARLQHQRKSRHPTESRPDANHGEKRRVCPRARTITKQTDRVGLQGNGRRDGQDGDDESLRGGGCRSNCWREGSVFLICSNVLVIIILFVSLPLLPM